MSSRKSWMVLGLVLLVSGAAGEVRAVQAPPMGKRQTAKGELQKALQRARAWQADAVFTGIWTPLADAEGKVDAWLAGAGWE